MDSCKGLFSEIRGIGPRNAAVVKIAFQRALDGDDRPDDEYKLRHFKRSAREADGIFAAAEEEEHDQRRHRQFRQSRAEPDPAEKPVRKGPGLFILHGARGAVADERVDLSGTAAAIIRADSRHEGRQQQCHDQHKGPESHGVRSVQVDVLAAVAQAGHGAGQHDAARVVLGEALGLAELLLGQQPRALGAVHVDLLRPLAGLREEDDAAVADLHVALRVDGGFP